MKIASILSNVCVLCFFGCGISIGCVAVGLCFVSVGR